VDSDAFAKVLRPLLVHSAAYARSLLRNRQDAEDAVQQAALRAWERIAQYDGTRPFKAWWFAIVRNCSFDIQRHRRQLRGAARVDAVDVPQESTAETQDWRVLDAALRALPPAHQEILRLRYFGDLSYEELSATLAIPKGTVMSRLHLARKALAAQWPQESP
jgi:RNA polymerase sigma-70 factor (ECF subfamily)